MNIDDMPTEKELRDGFEKACFEAGKKAAEAGLDYGVKRDLPWVREWWRRFGGDFHGPHVETATIPEADLARLIIGMQEEIDGLRNLLTYVRDSSMGSKQIKDYIRVHIPPNVKAERTA